jgi:hypothetical protein
MPAGERKLKWCKHGHIMGEIKKITTRERHVQALMLYEQSVELENVPDELPPLRGRVIGDVLEIRCTICKAAMIDWEIGQDAFNALMAHYPGRKDVNYG